MKRNWPQLPDSFFIGKHCLIGLPYEDKYKRLLDELVYVKVTGVDGEWLQGILDSDPHQRTDLKPGDVIHFLKDDIDRVLGVA